MNTPRMLALVGLILAASATTGVAPASAAGTYLEKRNGAYAVTPAMMHAIDVIVAEKMKMKRHRH